MVWVLGSSGSQLRFRLPLMVDMDGGRGRCGVEMQRRMGDLIGIRQRGNSTLPRQCHLGIGTGAFLVGGQYRDERRWRHAQGRRWAGRIQRGALLSVRLTGRRPDGRGAERQLDGDHSRLILTAVTREAWLSWRQPHQARSQK